MQKQRERERESVRDKRMHGILTNVQVRERLEVVAQCARREAVVCQRSVERERVREL